MVVRATGINPAMLRWARERAGYSIEQVASRLRVPSDRVGEWESGRVYPTWKQTEKLAHDLYNRSTTLFFLNSPPEEPTIQAEFPRLPPELLDDLHPDTLYAVRQARARQHYLRKITPAQGTADGRLMAALRNAANPCDPASLAGLVREHIGNCPLEKEQTRSGGAAIERWRGWIENAGVWIFMRRFRQADVSGFCLVGYRHPVIYLNYVQPPSLMASTILRQFAHLVFDFNHIEMDDPERYLGSLTGDALAIEKACNDFVEEFIDASENDHTLGPLAKTRKRGGNFYAVEAKHLGQKYLRAAFVAFEEERIDEATLSAALGVKAQALDRLEELAWHRGLGQN